MYKKIYNLIIINNFQNQLFAFGLFTIIGIFFETFGLAIIFPVLEVMSDPTKFQKYNFFKISVPSNSLYGVILYLPIIIIIFYIIKSLYLVFLYWQQSKFSAKLGEKISCNLYSNYLYKPYSFHVNKNSTELLRNIKTETLQFTEVIKSTLNIFLESLVLTSILILLIYIEPIASVSMLLFCVLLSVFFSKFTSKRLERWGQIRQAVSINTTKTINHSLGAIKDVKIFELENNFLNEFIHSNSKDVNIQKKMSTLAFLPRLFMEFVAVSGLMLFLFIIKLRGGNIQLLIPVLGIFLASAFRSIPSINRIITSLQFINFSRPVINLLEGEFKDFSNKINDTIISETIEFTQLKIENITFSYDKILSTPILKNVSLEINKGDIIGIIGESGAGKSTFVDIILGIYEVDSGRILFNNKLINEHKSEWFSQIGYIQQNVYLIDNTLASNIAFGIEKDKIDYNKLESAIQQANLQDFVNKLPNGINTTVGERGLRISGGQRQRIGIARALYREPNFLVFDEATSNLDYNTENVILETINNLSKTKTIIIIAHRQSTLVFCKYIYRVENGTLIKEI
jgi:ABC-type multidrug transport system fused ATPase/permease subunit